MWVLIGLFAALSATAIVDGFQGERPDDDNNGQADEDSAAQDQPGETVYQSLLQQLAESEDLETPAHVPSAALASDAGLFDHLDERIHSSDDFPAAQPPQPSYVVGTDEADRLVGGVSDDTLIGGGGNDTLIGAGGNTLLVAGSGNNYLTGGEGQDTLLGGTGDDTLVGGWGDDLLIAGGGDNLLMGGAGNDILIGAQLNADGTDQSGANILNGGSGNDLLIAGQGDSLHGGEGADSFALGDWLAGQAPATILDYSPDLDQIVLYLDTAYSDAAEITVTFDDANPTVAQIRLDGHVIANVLNAQGMTADAVALNPEHPDHMRMAAE